MGYNNYFDELIVSYLSNELNAEDEEFVLQWIHSSEQNERYFEEMKSTWLLLAADESTKNIDVEKEWEQFKLATDSRQEKQPETAPATVFYEVAKEVEAEHKKAILSFAAPFAIAAAIVALVVTGFKIFNTSSAKDEPKRLSSVEPAKSSIVEVKQLRNASNTTKHFTLIDGSKMDLYANSEISYYEPFTNQTRLITLSGKAHFSVAKDKSRPFIVVSGDIATTALGTQFTVTALPGKEHIKVKLFEGKVVVKSSDEAVKRFEQDYFLLPGDEFIYDNKRLTAKVKSFKRNERLAEKQNKKDTYTNDNPSIPTSGDGTWYMFNNQSLPQVFDQLSGMYNVQIAYTRNDILNNYFIGSFNIADSIDDILKAIASLNNLKVTKKNNKIIISK